VIRVVFEPLAHVPSEAILRPVRTDLAPVTAASRDLAVAAGASMEERLQRLGSLPVGGAVMTPAGILEADFVIHAVVMSEDEPQTTVTVQRALRNGLARAVDWGVASLAVPPLGLGAGLAEPEVAARALVEILANHVDEGRAPLDLTIVVTSSFEQELFERLVEEAARERSNTEGE